MSSIYDIADPDPDPDVATEFVVRLAHDLQDHNCTPEIGQLGRTIVRWHTQIGARHQARVSNGPTAINNLIKRIKRVAFGSNDSTTTGSAPCSTPASPTVTYSPPSQPLNAKRGEKYALYIHQMTAVQLRPGRDIHRQGLG